MMKYPSPLFLAVAFLFVVLLAHNRAAMGIEILSKSKLERCERSGSGPGGLHCDRKIVVNMAVPSGSSGGEASIVAEVVEVEENATEKMQTIRDPPILTINKSSAYALYEIMYIRDVAYKPQEFYVKTRKCEPDAGADVVHMCERLRDEKGNPIEHTQPTCCPCGPRRRVPSSCGNIFKKVFDGKANTAHCLRFPGEWYHIFGIGRRSLGFSIRIEVKKGSKISEVFVGPENRTVLSKDNFLRVNLIGDFAGYTSLPLFEDFYLVIPSQGAFGTSKDLGRDYSKWMLLERVRFSMDGFECNKIGVSYEAFNGQPNFCSSPYWSCLHNQLWNFWEADQNRIARNQSPQYIVQGRFERINQHPNAGTHSFSIGVSEVLNTNLLIELSADDIEYVYQRSPGEILDIKIPAFEALTQFGIATITTKNVGELEASYSLTFDCSSGVSHMEEQFFIMAPAEVTFRSFKLYPSTDQASNYKCTAILKASDFSEVDRAECQFITVATVVDNGSQITSTYGPKSSGISGFFHTIESFWKSLWNGLIDFLTGRSCRTKCSSFFDFNCHMKYACISWIILFSLFIAIFPAAIVLVWLLHQKGFFDPLHDWWNDHFRCGKSNAHAPRNNHSASFVHLHNPGYRHSHHKRNLDGAANLYAGHHIAHKHHKHHGKTLADRDKHHHIHIHEKHILENREKHKHIGQDYVKPYEHSRNRIKIEDFMSENVKSDHQHSRSMMKESSSHMLGHHEAGHHKHRHDKELRH